MKSGEKMVVVGIFSPYYPPAVQAGGPIQSLAALIQITPDGYQPLVLTSAYDLGTKQHLPVELNHWISEGRAYIRYITIRSPWRVVQGLISLRKRNPVLIYLNSFFNPVFSMLPLILWVCHFWGSARLLLAPRGQFSRTALQHHSVRKKAVLSLVRTVRICSNVTWQSTSQTETEDIHRVFGESAKVIFRKNDIALSTTAMPPIRDDDGPIRLVFLGRMTSWKGLDIVLRALSECTTKVVFDAYGPHQDLGYLQECEKLATLVPSNVQVHLHGVVLHSEVQSLLNGYDVFVYPTCGESFGNVIVEALAASCIVLVTPYTPWSDVVSRSGGAVIDRDDIGGWCSAIENLSHLSSQDIVERRGNSGHAFESWTRDSNQLHIFQLAMDQMSLNS